MALVLGWLLNMSCYADELSREYKIKAAYLVNIVQYVTWPEETFASDETAIRLCVDTNMSFVHFLEGVIASKQAAAAIRPIIVESWQPSALCHLRYVTKTKGLKRGFVFNGFTVGDNTRFRRYGTVINFYTEDRRVRFEVNNTKLNENNLKLSSKLLKLARIYE